MQNIVYSRWIMGMEDNFEEDDEEVVGIEPVSDGRTVSFYFHKRIIQV